MGTLCMEKDLKAFDFIRLSKERFQLEKRPGIRCTLPCRFGQKTNSQQKRLDESGQ